MAQCPEGFLYFGIEEGIWQHDGERAVRVDWPAGDTLHTTCLFPFGDSLVVGTQEGLIFLGPASGPLSLLAPQEGHPDVPITALAVDALGHLWIGTAGEGLYVELGKLWYAVSTQDGLPSNHINGMYPLDSALGFRNGVRVATDKGPAEVTSQGLFREVFCPTQKPINLNLSTCIASGDQGGSWVGFVDGQVAYWAPRSDSLVIMPPAEDAPREPIVQIAEAGGRLWVGSEDGSIFYASPGDTMARVMFLGKTREPGRLDAMLALREGRMLVVTDRYRLHDWNPSLSAGLPNQQTPADVQAIILRRNGHVWYSTLDGLFRFSPDHHQSAQRIEPRSFPTDAVVVSLFESADESVWVGTFDAGAWRFSPEGGALAHYPLDSGSAGSVLAMAETPEGIWLATLGGIYWLAPDGTSPRFVDGGIGRNFVYALYRDLKGLLWAGTDGDGLHAMEIGPQGSLRVKRHHLAGQTIYGLIQDTAGVYWAHSRESGLLMWDGVAADWEPIHGIPPPDHDLLSLSQDAHGDLLAFHDIGIHHISTTGNTPRYLPLQNLSTKPQPRNGAVQYRDGATWFGTDHGPFRLEGTLDELPEAPSVRLVSVLASGVPLPSHGRVKASRRHLEFFFRGPWHGADNATVFEYRLPGVEDTWRSTRDNRVSFVNLPSGPYMFEVRARLGETGPPGKMTRQSFAVAAPLWLQAWFLVLVLALLLVAVYALVRARENRMKRIQEQENDRLRSQFEVLRNQVNPHFLFNSFNTLSSLIEENQPRAVDYVHRLAGFFRNILTHREEDIVTLAEELALLEDYAALQHARYEDNLSISVDVENALLKKGIPPMTLQLLVENAIKHNIITRQHPLFVQIVSVGSETIEVSNAIQPRPTPPPSTGLGLENLDRKFALLKADAPKVSVDGNVFRVRISLVQKTPFA